MNKEKKIKYVCDTCGVVWVSNTFFAKMCAICGEGRRAKYDYDLPILKRKREARTLDITFA